MYKFEAKPVQGKLQISVTKDTRTAAGSKPRLVGLQQAQKLQVLRKTRSHSAEENNVDKFDGGRRPRPRTTPSAEIVNLDDDDDDQQNRKLHRHRASASRLGVTKIIADSRSNQSRSVDDIRQTKKAHCVVAQNFHPPPVPHGSRENAKDALSSASETLKANTTVSVACETRSPNRVASVANSVRERFASNEIPTAWSIESSDGGHGDIGSNRADSSLATTSRPESASIPKRMSLLEQKRLQWAAEKAQMGEWNPWGRPGGGAPHCQISQSNYFNSTGPMVSAQINEEGYNVCKHGVTGAGRQLPPLTQSKASDENPTSIRILQAATFSAMGYIGEEALVRNCACSAFRDENRRQWLEDQQKDEQRQRKVQDKLYYNKNLNDMNIGETAQNVDAVECTDLHFVRPPPSRSRTSCNVNGNDVPPPPTSISMDANNWNYNNASQRTFLRGANVPLDAETQNEMAKKRERALEHRKAIQSQLEDRLQQKRAEKVRQRQEELEEELKMRQECERLEREYLQEQQKMKSKHDSELETRELLKRQNDKTEASKPIKHRHHHHHHHNHALSPHLPDVLDGTKQIEIKTIEVPTEVDLKDCQLEYLSKGSLIEHAPYVHNRVLTPTKYRDTHLMMRDFSTQTDMLTIVEFPTRKNKATITRSRNDEQREADGSRQSRSKACRKAARNRESRPQWGANRPAQNYKTQSEKYLDGDALSRLPNQKKVLKEAVENIDDPTPLPKPRLSGKKTRSSAEHQRKLFAKESVALSTMQRGPMHPFESTRPTVTGCSDAGSAVRNDTAVTDDQSGLTTRHQRRKWQSPCRQEAPNFYTDSPQLPDVRNVRRVTVSNNGRTSKDGRIGTGTGVNDGDPVDSSPVIFRSDSPPVPALRNKLANSKFDMRSLILASPVKEKTFVVTTRATSSHAKDSRPSPSEVRPPTRADDAIYSSASQETLIPSPSETNELGSDQLQRRYTAPSYFQSTPAQNVDQLSEILNKLTLIRQGLFLKQREVEDLLVVTPTEVISKET